MVYCQNVKRRLLADPRESELSTLTQIILQQRGYALDSSVAVPFHSVSLARGILCILLHDGTSSFEFGYLSKHLRLIGELFRWEGCLQDKASTACFGSSNEVVHIANGLICVESRG